MYLVYLNISVFCCIFRLLEQIKNPKCKAVVGVLNAAKSKSLTKWRELVCFSHFQTRKILHIYVLVSHSSRFQDARITDAANEAKDNVKYLYTLDKFFGPLVKCTPVRDVS